VTVKSNATLKDIWRKLIEQPGLLVQIKHQKNHVLELDAYIDYPLAAKFNEQDNEELDLNSVCQSLIVLFGT